MSSSSLSSVVSSLVRASMGSSVPNSVTDEELDRHVAELILKEAKQKAERYLQEGVSAYLPDKGPDANLPRANKRFLSTIIRSTDEHNRTILRAQAEAAAEVKAEREEQERRERRARALEATEAERLRRLMGGPSRRHEAMWDRRRDSGRKLGSRDSRDEHGIGDGDGHHDRRRRKRHSRSRSPERRDDDSDRHRRRRYRDEESGEESESRKHRRRSRPKSPDSERYKSRRKGDGSREYEQLEESIDLPSKSKRKGKERDESGVASTLSSRTSRRATPRDDAVPEGSDKDDVDSSMQPSQRPMSPQGKDSTIGLAAQFEERKAKLASTPPPPPSPTLSEEEDIERYRPRRRQRAFPETKSTDSFGQLPSKMDKYFEESYDPRLDTGPLTIPNVPSTGLLEGSEFEAWEAMLDVIRQRREDKTEKKRLERLGLLPDSKTKEKESKSLKDSEAWTMNSGTSALDIKYNKRGTVREWDVGKAGF